MSVKMASLVLEDGTEFKGRLFGAISSVSGEVGKWNKRKCNWNMCPYQPYFLPLLLILHLSCPLTGKWLINMRWAGSKLHVSDFALNVSKWTLLSSYFPGHVGATCMTSQKLFRVRSFLVQCGKSLDKSSWSFVLPYYFFVLFVYSKNSVVAIIKKNKKI